MSGKGVIAKPIVKPCLFCKQACHVPRLIPGDAGTWQLATCPDGMALDRHRFGVDSQSATPLPPW